MQQPKRQTGPASIPGGPQISRIDRPRDRRPVPFLLPRNDNFSHYVRTGPGARGEVPRTGVGGARVSSGLIVAVVAVFVLWTCLSVAASGE